MSVNFNPLGQLVINNNCILRDWQEYEDDQDEEDDQDDEENEEQQPEKFPATEREVSD